MARNGARAQYHGHCSKRQYEKHFALLRGFPGGELPILFLHPADHEITAADFILQFAHNRRHPPIVFIVNLK